MSYTLATVTPRFVDALLTEEQMRALSARRIGSHQVDILTNRARWSCSDLRGKASSYAGRYKASRDAAWDDLCRILPEPLRPRVERVERTLEVVWPEPELGTLACLVELAA